MSSRGTCAGNAVFFHTKVESESKIAREMPGFTIETAVRGPKVGGVRRRFRLWSPMSEYVQIGSPLGSEFVGHESHCNGDVEVALGGRFAAPARARTQRVANPILMLVSRWLWV